jgi:PAS domain S-box-containing protein
MTATGIAAAQNTQARLTDSPIARLLIVDDEVPQMKALRDTLETEGYHATAFHSAGAALAALRHEEFDLVLTDLMMPEMDGVTFLSEAIRIDPAIAGIVMTGHGTLTTAVEAMQAGALDYILKPFRLSTVLPVLARSLAIRKVRLENVELHQAVGMYELSRTVGFALDPDTVLQKVADTACAQSGVRGVLVLLAAETGDFRVAAARGVNAAALAGARIPASDALAEWLTRSHDLGWSITPGHNCAPLDGLPGSASVPMMAAGHVVGILHFEFDHGRPARAGQIKAFHILASAAASAIQATSAVERMRAADKQYRRLAENAADVIFRYDLEPVARLAYVNEAVTAVTGYSPAEFYADPGLIFRIVHPGDRAQMEKTLRGACPHGSTAGIRSVHRNGNVVWLEQRAMHVRGEDGHFVAIEAIARDVTDRKQLVERLEEGTKALRRSLVEKTALLQEVHHRVKNNLQLICSLLSMQIDCSRGDSFSRPLNDAHSRVLSMSLIHEQIYQSETMADLDFAEYVEALSSRLFGLYCIDLSRIRLELDLKPIRLSPEQAIPCGLILNELISNSLKHAFSDGSPGLIRISLDAPESGDVELAVADNGAGLPANFSIEGSPTLGLQVVSTLIRQLGATLSISGEHGAVFQFSWKPERS